MVLFSTFSFFMFLLFSHLFEYCCCYLLISYQLVISVIIRYSFFQLSTFLGLARVKEYLTYVWRPTIWLTGPRMETHNLCVNGSMYVETLTVHGSIHIHNNCC